MKGKQASDKPDRSTPESQIHVRLFPGTLVVARRGSPIVLGVGENGTIVASDASAIISHTQRVIYLDDHDIAIVTADSVDIRDLDNAPVDRAIDELSLACGLNPECRQFARDEPDFDSLRTDERFRQLLRPSNTST